MPTYNNPINFGSGFKLGQGVPVDDRYVFNDLAQANAFIVSSSFFLYEGLWSYLLNPGDYYVYQRTDPSIPWDVSTNPYIWRRYSEALGGLPLLGLPHQQLIVNEAGDSAIYDWANQRDLHRFVGAAAANPSITEGMFVRHVNSTSFEDVHLPANYPINASSKLPLYFVFKIDGDDLIVGKQGIYKSVGHLVTPRVPLYLRSTFSGTGTYYQTTMTPTKTTVDGELVYPVGLAIDSNTLYINLLQPWVVVDTNTAVIGNATISRTLIQRAGNGGIPEDGDGFFTIPHGFGDQRGHVQIVAMQTTPPPYVGGSGNIMVTPDAIAFESGAIRVKLDYGVVDQTLLFEVIYTF